MKNTFKLFRIIAMLAVIGFSMAACNRDDGDTDVKLAGTTWNYEQPAIFNGQTIQVTTILTFIDSTTVKGDVVGGPPIETTSGTYTISGNSGTINLSFFGSGDVPFVVNGNKLTVQSCKFIKQ